MADRTENKILIVDDDELTLHALEMTLMGEGYEVFKSSTGRGAIDLLRSDEFAVIICDHYMPEISGVEVLKEALELQPDCVRIVLTGGGDLNQAAELINVGQISQFILKPWNYHGLLQTVRNSIEKYRLLRENKELHRLTLKQHDVLIKSHDRLQRDLSIGGQVQKALLEGEIPENIEGIEIKGATIPSQFIDGDFFGFYRQGKSTLDIVIGDVMGKGLPAALVGTAVKSQLTRFAMPKSLDITFEKEKGWYRDLLSPAEILNQVHNEVTKPLMDLEYFVSLFYGRIDLEKRTICFVDCGSTKPFHYRAKENCIEELTGDNFPLGIMAEEEYRMFSRPFSEKDLFVFYSDGLTEASNHEGELFGSHRLQRIIRENFDEEPADLIARIHSEVKSFTQADAYGDDLTLFIFRVGEISNCNSFSHRNSAKFTSDISQLCAVRSFVKDFCNHSSMGEGGIAETLQLAVDEVFCNIVKHGYDDKKGGEVILQGFYDNDTITLEILDKGTPFDPSKIHNPSFAGDRSGGFGLYLIKQIADKIKYVPKSKGDGWNQFTISKKVANKGSSMEISHQLKDNVLIISLEGENLDAKGAPIFKQKIMELVNETGVYRLILDMTKLDFIDSTGLGSFLSLLRTLNSHQGDLKLAHMSRPIRTIFELVCMHKIFEIYNDTNEALQSFQSVGTKG